MGEFQSASPLRAISQIAIVYGSRFCGCQPALFIFKFCVLEAYLSSWVLKVARGLGVCVGGGGGDGSVEFKPFAPQGEALSCDIPLNGDSLGWG